MQSKAPITVIGGGLAGCECAFQLAERGHAVVLREQKPRKRSPAHVTDGLAELVCSNSFRSDNPESAVGLLHRELRRLKSLILACADEARVPAGDALAVDREVTALPEGEVVVATGPLTSEALTGALNALTGEKLAFYDAIAPIVADESVDHSIAFRASRYGKGSGADYLNLPMDEETYRAFVQALRAGEKVKNRSTSKAVCPSR
jgi:methylenetetrahydrofolate--tRNA-(uracil-5-)-methyltransferase